MLGRSLPREPSLHVGEAAATKMIHSEEVGFCYRAGHASVLGFQIFLGFLGAEEKLHCCVPLPHLTSCACMGIRWEEGAAPWRLPDPPTCLWNCSVVSDWSGSPQGAGTSPQSGLLLLPRGNLGLAGHLGSGLWVLSLTPAPLFFQKGLLLRLALALGCTSPLDP